MEAPDIHQDVTDNTIIGETRIAYIECSIVGQAERLH
jgi:hypothetical protein